MGRRPCKCLAQLKHLLPFGPVAGAACSRAGRALPRRGGAGGNEAVRVGTTEAGRVSSTEVGRMGSTEAGRWVVPRRSAVNDSSFTCSESLLRKLRGTIIH